MRKIIFAALATAVLAPASFFAGPASAQVAPFSKFQQMLEQSQISTAYAARGGRGGGGRVHGAAMRRPAGMHAGAYRGNVARAGVYFPACAAARSASRITGAVLRAQRERHAAGLGCHAEQHIGAGH